MGGGEKRGDENHHGMTQCPNGGFGSLGELPGRHQLALVKVSWGGVDKILVGHVLSAGRTCLFGVGGR